MADDVVATAFEARKLLRAARSGTLATLVPGGGDGGQPFASLVTPACAPDLSLLLLLSDLSEHTRHLRAEPRCSILVTGTAEDTNPQTAPRLTVTGIAEIADDPGLKARYLSVHPYASVYIGFGDFHLWRVRAMAALYVGGFARAARLKQADLAPDPQAVATIGIAEAAIVSHCNNDHPDALAAIAGEAGAWRMTSADVDGADLVLGESTRRVHWSAPMANADEIRTELVRMTRLARGSDAGPPDK